MNLTSKRDLTLDNLRIALQRLMLLSDWEDISVQHIAHEADVSIGTFYNYFDSKELALQDVRAILSDVIQRDLALLLKTQSDPSVQITYVIKYLYSLYDSQASWARYLYGGHQFSDRLDNGLSKILLPIIYAGLSEKSFTLSDITAGICFIESGIFAMIKTNSATPLSFAQAAALAAEFTLKVLGVEEGKINTLVTLECPSTPIAELPISALSLKELGNEYV